MREIAVINPAAGGGTAPDIFGVAPDTEGTYPEPDFVPACAVGAVDDPADIVNQCFGIESAPVGFAEPPGIAFAVGGIVDTADLVVGVEVVIEVDRIHIVTGNDLLYYQTDVADDLRSAGVKKERTAFAIVKIQYQMGVFPGEVRRMKLPQIG